MIELRQFRQFIAVAETLSFRRAAERLHMAQPPLSAAIKKIEAELGVPLIKRTNRVTCLTDAGQIFFDEATRAVAQAERAIRSAKRAGSGLTGLLRVTFGAASAGNDLLPRTLRTFRACHADVELELKEAPSALQVAALLEDRADLGFLVPPVRDGSGLSIEVLFQDELVVALPETHPLAERDGLTLADLSSEPWILVSARHAPGLHERIVMACAKAGFSPRVAQEAVQKETIASLVAGGIGVALLPKSLAEVGWRGVVFRYLAGNGTPVTYELALVYGATSPTIDAFAAVARAEAKAL